jgi:hypothetical protein
LSQQAPASLEQALYKAWNEDWSSLQTPECHVVCQKNRAVRLGIGLPTRNLLVFDAFTLRHFHKMGRVNSIFINFGMKMVTAETKDKCKNGG